MSKFGMRPCHTPYRPTMCLPASSTMPISAFTFIPDLNQLDSLAERWLSLLRAPPVSSEVPGWFSQQGGSQLLPSSDLHRRQAVHINTCRHNPHTNENKSPKLRVGGVEPRPGGAHFNDTTPVRSRQTIGASELRDPVSKKRTRRSILNGHLF